MAYVEALSGGDTLAEVVGKHFELSFTGGVDRARVVVISFVIFSLSIVPFVVIVIVMVSIVLVIVIVIFSIVMAGVIVVFSIVIAIISIWIYTVCAPVVVLEYDPVRRSDAFACLQWVLEWSAWEVR